MRDLPLKIDVVIGSQSDLPQILTGLWRLAYEDCVDLHVHVISCHRNPKTLLMYALICEADVVIAVAGLAAALPGVLKANLDWLQSNRNLPVIGVGLEGKTLRQNLAATTSIDQLPGTPVALSRRGTAYAGKSGFNHACRRALTFPRVPAEENHPSREKAEMAFEHLPPENPPSGKEAILNWNWKHV